MSFCTPSFRPPSSILCLVLIRSFLEKGLFPYQGTTILYTTHYMEEAERLGNRIAIIDEGQIVALGTLKQLLAMRDQNREVQRPHGLQELFIQLTAKTLRD